MVSSYLIRDVCVGVGLGLLSSTFPFRVYEYEAAMEANRIVSEVARWLEDSIEALVVREGGNGSEEDRRHHRGGNSSSTGGTIGAVMSMRRRRAKAMLALQKMRQSAAYAWYEPINGLEVAYLEVRCDLLANVVSVLEVITDLCDDTRTVRSPLWSQHTREYLGPALQDFGDAMREFCTHWRYDVWRIAMCCEWFELVEAYWPVTTV